MFMKEATANIQNVTLAPQVSTNIPPIIWPVPLPRIETVLELKHLQSDLK